MAIPPHEQSALLSTQSVQDWYFQDILRLPTREREEWKKACLEELESLRVQKVFELTDLPKGRKVIKNRWVFDIKQDGRKKASLIAKGFSQVEGIDFNEIFSPVVYFKTVRLILALSLLEDWYIEALDVKTAFLYGKLDEEIYMHQPEGFKLKGQEYKVLHLHLALYGLKKAALSWWRELETSMKRLGFGCTTSNAGMFFTRKEGQLVIAVVYVDDALFFGKNKEAVKRVKKTFMDIWEC